MIGKKSVSKYVITYILFTERVVIDVWIQVIDPTVPDLFSNPTRQFLRQIRPSGEGILQGIGHRFDDDLIFFVSPLAFTRTGFEEAYPSFLAFFRAVNDSRLLSHVKMQRYKM